MMRSLAAFARKGDPNDRSLGVYWPAWPATLLFDASDRRAEISVLP
jgi:para-nitrobenzyl esterase